MQVRARDGLHELRRGRRTLLRFGTARGRLVAGTGSADALRALGRAPVRRADGARGGVAFHAPGPALADWLTGWQLRGFLHATPDETTATVRLRPR